MPGQPIVTVWRSILLLKTVQFCKMNDDWNNKAILSYEIRWFNYLSSFYEHYMLHGKIIEHVSLKNRKEWLIPTEEQLKVFPSFKKSLNVLH